MGLQLLKRVSRVTLNGPQALYCFRLEVCLKVHGGSANQPAGSLGDLGQPRHVVFFEAAKLAEAVECHHELHYGCVKQFQKVGADVEGLRPLREVQPLVTLRQEGQETSPAWSRLWIPGTCNAPRSRLTLQ